MSKNELKMTKDEAWKAVGHILGNEFDKWFAEYKTHRDSLAQEACELEKYLWKLLIPLKGSQGCLIYSVTARPKEFDSLVRSAYRKWLAWKADDDQQSRPPFDWSYAAGRLGDLVGARVVGLTRTDVVRFVRRILSAKSFVWQRPEIQNYYDHAKPSGYRSWQVQLEWRPEERTPVVPRVEVQVRTLFDDAWSQWDHLLFYKRPAGMSLETWDELRDAFDRQRLELADSIQRISQTSEEVRRVFREHSSPFLATSPRHPPDDVRVSTEIAKVIKKRLGTHILAANLQTGLRRDNVHIRWKRKRFFGLELVDQDQQENHEVQQERRQRFDFGELEKVLGKTDAPLRVRLDDAEAAAQQLDGSGFPAAAAQLLRCCYQKTRDQGRAHYAFFNEYQARLNSHDCDKKNPTETPWLTVELCKTNFAYEVCTTYVLERERTIIPDENGCEDPDVKRYKEEVRKTLVHPFKREDHAANPVGVHVNLISCTASGDLELIVMKRSTQAALHQLQWSTSVSGVMVPLRESIEAAGDIPGLFYEVHGDPDRPPCLFRAAQRELEEELGLHVPIDDIRVIALLQDQQTSQPIVVAEALTGSSLDEIKKSCGTAPEEWEVGGLVSLPLTQEGLDHLANGKPGTDLEPAIPSILTVAGIENGEQNGFWQARSAAAVLLCLLRYRGAGPVHAALGI